MSNTLNLTYPVSIINENSKMAKVSEEFKEDEELNDFFKPSFEISKPKVTIHDELKNNRSHLKSKRKKA
jgi:hypothetical protein